MPRTAKPLHLSLSLAYRGLKQPSKSSFPGLPPRPVISNIVNTCELLIFELAYFAGGWLWRESVPAAATYEEIQFAHLRPHSH